MNHVLTILRARPEDTAEIARIHVAAWQTAYRDIVPSEFLAKQSVEKRRHYWLSVVAEGLPALLVAKHSEQVVGWIAFAACRDAGSMSRDAEVWALYVDPAYWSQGVGMALWHSASTQLISQGFRSASLWVLADNQRAIRFYKAAGFHQDRIAPKEIVIGGKKLHEIRYVAALKE